ncbi:MAG: MerR family transcriptional regulator [Azospirillum sp.]|nr:MerR family transcriptional regulator [Azospirillum sp.]
MSVAVDRAGMRARGATKSASAFRTISEVSTELEVPQHVLRFWETKFPQVRPLKRGGGRRYYRPEDVDLLRRIQRLLYSEGYTIKGVQRLLRDPNAAATGEGDDDEGAGHAEPLIDGEPADLDEAAGGHHLSEAQRAELESILDELEDLRSLLRSCLRK